jgi:hypothetical protein
MVTRTSSQTFLTLGSEFLVNTETASSQRQPSVAAVNGGVKFGHCGGAKVGQFGASALERAALI